MLRAAPLLVALALPCAAGALEGGDLVLGVDVAGNSRAYPTASFERPAVLNDDSGRLPVIVFYDPRSEYAAAYFSMMAGEPLEFSGRATDELVADDLTTASRWDMRTGQAVGGALAGLRLVPIPVRRETFGSWRESHPRGTVWEDGRGGEGQPSP